MAKNDIAGAAGGAAGLGLGLLLKKILGDRKQQRALDLTKAEASEKSKSALDLQAAKDKGSQALDAAKIDSFRASERKSDAERRKIEQQIFDLKNKTPDAVEDPKLKRLIEEQERLRKSLVDMTNRGIDPNHPIFKGIAGELADVIDKIKAIDDPAQSALDQQFKSLQSSKGIAGGLLDQIGTDIPGRAALTATDAQQEPSGLSGALGGFASRIDPRDFSNSGVGKAEFLLKALLEDPKQVASEVGPDVLQNTPLGLAGGVAPRIAQLIAKVRGSETATPSRFALNLNRGTAGTVGETPEALRRLLGI